MNSSVFSEYKKFLKSKEFDFKNSPLYEDCMNNSKQWQEYKQTMLKFVWESNGIVSLSTLVDDLFQTERKRPIYESTNEKNINTLLANVFGESDESLIVPGSVVDVVEIISSDNVVKISIDENVRINEVMRLQNEMMFKSSGKIYTTGKHLHQTIELVIITKPNTAKNKLAKIALVSDVDQHGTRTYAGWIIDFPSESFATRMNKKFMETKMTKRIAHEDQVQEGWKEKVGAGAIAAGIALGANAGPQDQTRGKITEPTNISQATQEPEFRQDWKVFKNKQDRMKKMADVKASDAIPNQRTASASVGTLDDELQEGFGTAVSNFLIGKEATAGLRKLGGMAAGTVTGSMSRKDIMARDDYIKDFTSKVYSALDSGVKSGTLVKAPSAEPAPASPVAEGAPSVPHIRTYTKTYANGEKVNRYEVLDYKGRRVSGQGTEGFDDKKTATEFLRKNKLKFSDPLNEAVANSQTISEYIVSTVEYYAEQAGVQSIEKFRPTIVGLAQQIEQAYPSRQVSKLIQQLANLVYSLSSSTMQRTGLGSNEAGQLDLTDQTGQVMKVVNAMNKPTDIDDVAQIAKAAIQKLYKGDQAMMNRMFNAVDVKAQERMGQGIGSQK